MTLLSWQARSRIGRVFACLTCGCSTMPVHIWLLYVILFLESFAWFSESSSFVVFVGRQFQMDDVEAGWAYAWWGVGLTVFSFVAGPIIDAVGFKTAIFIGCALSSLARTFIGASINRHAALWMSYTMYALATSMIEPSVRIGTKRFLVHETERVRAFSLLYTVRNAGALCGFLSVDWFRQDNFRTPFIGTPHDGLRMLRFLNALIAIVCATLAVAFGCLPKSRGETQFERKILEARIVEASESIQSPPSPSAPRRASSCWNRAITDVRAILFDERNRNFWRLFAFAFLLIGVRSVFPHLDTIFPKYVARAIDPDGKYGQLLMINPLLIIILSPLLTELLASRFTIYPLIVFGTLISAAAVFILALAGTYTSIIMFMVVFSIGEAIYGPRLDNYALSISRDGKEGLYATLASFPFFAIKIVSGIESGHLLQTYCPESGIRNCNYMWFLIGLTALGTPFLLMMFRPFLDVVGRAGRDGVSTLSARAELRQEEADFTIVGLVREANFPEDDEIERSIDELVLSEGRQKAFIDSKRD